MKQAFSMVRGTTQKIAITVTDESGAPYTLSSGETLRFGVKKYPENNSSPYIITKQAAAGDLSDGAYIITINPGDTELVPTGTYYYDVGLQSGSDYYPVIECSEFRITTNVTRRVVS